MNTFEHLHASSQAACHPISLALAPFCAVIFQCVHAARSVNSHRCQRDQSHGFDGLRAFIGLGAF